MNMLLLRRICRPADARWWDASGLVHATSRKSSVLTFALGISVGAVGCGTATTSQENWAYSGPDVTLKSPPPIPAGDNPPDVRTQRYRESFEAWQQKRRDAARSANESCARQTGETGMPGLWTGYSKAFVDCMRAQGWSRVGNPL